MFFNSIEYFIFFGSVIFLYYLLPHRAQNRMLLIASYIFYGWWDWRFLSLIIISTVTDYICGIQINKHETVQRKKYFLIVSVVVNLTLLGFFKYWNFFTDSFADIISCMGMQVNISTLNIILPVGISFYTFQTLTYSVDIYRGKIKPSQNFLDFALFVSFFPQLVAGPIERAQNLLPQIYKKRRFKKDQMLRGIHLIFWGLFKKVYVADNLGIIVDQVYGNPASTGVEYVIATWAFAFQIYGDFSGYSDIARGTSKCLGIELMHNFKQPYFAVSPSDLWRRWHISLSSWLRDYLYISLGGNRKGKWKTHRNLMITMLLGGLWHGAAWNFVIWGGFHGLLLSIQRLFQSIKGQKTELNSSLHVYFLKSFFMFHLTCIGWIFFRANSLEHIKTILFSMLNLPWNIQPHTPMLYKVMFFSALPIIVMMFKTVKEVRPLWVVENSVFRYFQLSEMPLPARSVLYSVLTYLLCFYGAKAQSFIYFQF